MELSKIVRRFLVPGFMVTGIYAMRFGCLISHRAEVELSGNLKVGKKSQIGSYTKIKASDGPLEIGHTAFIGCNCSISSSSGGVYIGDYAMISSNVSIIGNNYRYDDLETPICQQEQISQGIRIGRNVWIGAGSVILDGAEIGEGCIVTPGSVVSGQIPPNRILQGNPAQIIFERR